MRELVRDRVRIIVPALGCVLGALVALLLGALVPPSAVRDEMPGGMYRAEGLFDPPGHAVGFYSPETLPDGTTFRWTPPRATLIFPYAAHMGRHAQVSLRLSGIVGDRPPARVKLSLNGKLYPEITVGHEFQVWSTELDAQLNPNPYLHPAHIQLDIETAPFTFPDPNDERELGVAVDWAVLTPERSRTELIIEAAVWGLTLGVVLLVAVLRFSLIWSLVYGTGTLVSYAIAHLLYTPIAIPPVVEVTLVGLAWLLAAALAPRGRPAWGLALAACGLWLALAGRILTDWQLDDAYISYRYAWNLAHGHGLVYNLGEVVEGYTNFLWTVLVALALAVGLPPVGFTLAMNIALSIGLAAVVYWLVEKLSGGKPLWALLALALLAVDNSIVTYGARGSGMEAMLFAFLAALSAALLWSQRRAWGGLVLALAALTRPEGLLVAAVFLLVMVGQDRLARQSVWRNLLHSLVPFMAVTVTYQVWRIGFYGYLFPNTFYAKTGATSALISRGFTYWGWFFYEHMVLVFLASLGLAAAALEWLPRLRRRVSGLRALGVERFMGMRTAFGLTSVGMALYVIWIGGDYFPGFPGWRFLVPVMAFIVVLAVEGVRSIFELLPQRAPVRAAAVAVLVAVVAFGFWRQWLSGPQVNIAAQTKLNSSYVDRWGSAGLWLRENTPAGTLTAVKGAGAIAYYAQRPMLDAYGLNDLHIGHLQVENMGAGKAGHEKTDPQYVLGRQPDYILELANYLAPMKAQFEAGYHVETHRSPTGVNIEWWKHIQTQPQK